MAEALLRKMLRDKGRYDIQVSSAGTSATNGIPPTDKTIEVMKKEEVDVSGYRTFRLNEETIEKADLILTMQGLHTDVVADLVPAAKDKTFLLKEYTNKKGDPQDFSIPDPIGRPLEIYERVFYMVKESIEELVKKI